MRREIPLGLLFSVTGTDGEIGVDALDGARLAVEEINSDDAWPFTFKPVIRDPNDSLSAFRRYSEEMLRDHGCNQIIGTVTSSSRKEVIPVIEKYDALLWYCCPYEGFEACENVIYIGSTPNQHIVPLFKHIIPRFGANAYLTGSNYIWGWETNRVARELITACGGEVKAEKYIALGVEDVDRLIDDIETKKPDFIFNNLIGTSSYAFHRAYYALGQRNPCFTADRCPIVSCNVTEGEIASVGVSELAGHYTTSIYFENQPGKESRAMRDMAREKLGADRRSSTYMVANYVAVKMLAAAIRDCGSDDINAVRANLHARRFDTELGPLQIDSKTNHAALRPAIGRFDGKHQFDIVDAATELVDADPFFVTFEAASFAKEVAGLRSQRSKKHLRVVK